VTPYRVLHISYGGFGSPFASQTLGLVKALESAGVPTGVLVFARPEEAAQVGGAYAGEAGGLSGYLTVLPCLPLVGRTNFSLARRQSASLIRNAAADGHDVILHCRGQFGAYLGLLLRDAYPELSLRVIADFRGNEADEIKVQSGQGARLKPLRRLVSPALTRWRVALARRVEAEVVRKADGFSFVSGAFRREIQLKYRTTLAPSVVVPTCTSFSLAPENARDALRLEAKAKLGLGAKYVVVYNGTFFPWQEPMGIVRAFQSCKEVRSEAHLLVVTTSPAEARSFLREAGVSAVDWTVVSAPHAEVPNYLLAGDVGLLLRRPSPINSVASPMKFAEYVACGVPVLASAGIGDLDGMISTYGVGRVLVAPGEAGRALGSLKFSYDGAYRLLREHYSWAGAVKKLQWLYERVLTQYARTG